MINFTDVACICDLWSDEGRYPHVHSDEYPFLSDGIWLIEDDGSLGERLDA